MLGLSWLQQLLGYHLFLAVSERTNQDRLHLTYSRSAPKLLHQGQGSTSTHLHQHHPCPARPCRHGHRVSGDACPARDQIQHLLRWLPQHPRLCSCNSTEPGPGSMFRCCESSSSPLSPPPSTREPWVTFNSPAQSPQPSHTAAGSQALTSKDWGVSAFTWLAMPTG